ncbi:MAG: hypothetical protein JKY42_09220 [Flavobacteriales bacterium]|nr:hypothetical protein [Flavobacteriales bacterium]
MKKIYFIIGTLIVSNVCTLFLYRIHKNKQQEELKANLIYNILNQNCKLETKIKTYIDSTTTLWSDRTYTSKTAISELVNLNFVIMPRNFKGQILGFCDVETTIYTIGNEKEHINLQDWEYVKPILVWDAYAPRSMTGLFKRKINKGSFVLNYHDLRPSSPIFFKGEELIIHCE